MTSGGAGGAASKAPLADDLDLDPLAGTDPDPLTLFPASPAGVNLFLRGAGSVPDPDPCELTAAVAVARLPVAGFPPGGGSSRYRSIATSVEDLNDDDGGGGSGVADE